MPKPEKVDTFNADIVSVLQQKTAEERRSGQFVRLGLHQMTEMVETRSYRPDRQDRPLAV